MLNLDPAKLLIIAVVAVILLGPDKLPQVARQAGVGRLALFHHDPTHDDDTLDRFAAKATEQAAGAFDVFMAVEGTQVELEPSTAGPPSRQVIASRR